jgi:hypothetical protein
MRKPHAQARRQELWSSENVPLDASPPVVEQLPLLLTPDLIERLAAQTSRQLAAPLEVRATGVVTGSFGAEGRLLGLLALRLLSGSPTVLRLPDRVGPEGLSSSTGSARLVTHELVGFMLARLAGDVVDRDGRSARRDVFELQRVLLKKSEGRLDGFGLQAYPFIDSYPGVAASELAASFSVRDGTSATSRAELQRELANAGIAAPGAADLGRLIVVLFEALDNTERHATRDLAGRAIPGLRLLAIRWRRFADLDVAGLSAAGSAALRDYVLLLENMHGREFLRSRYLVEFLVGDCGVGVPAHKLGSTHVYRERHAVEVDALAAAFRTSETAPRDGWEGFGLLKIQRAVKQLDGLLTVRTGRTFASRHHLDPNDGLDVTAVVPDEHERPLLGGTNLSVFVPWLDAQDTLFGTV